MIGTCRFFKFLNFFGEFLVDFWWIGDEIGCVFTKEFPLSSVFFILHVILRFASEFKQF